MKTFKLMALALVTAAAAGVPGTSAATPSCVGQYASTFAREGGRTFGADTSFGAQFASQPNYGAGVVAPYAHEPRSTC
jgi:hypothetical protein